MDHEKLHSLYKYELIRGRYLNSNHLKYFIQANSTEKRWTVVGTSVQNRPIYCGQFGQGKVKVLMWSQMHGNETTTTKGLLDFINFLNGETAEAASILSAFQFLIVPILNPDGAERYTRANANEVDLNRDFQELSQPESQLLMSIFTDFKPDYCFNLHDQRTIFGVGKSGKPATISFLAPSFNQAKDYDAMRLKSVAMIMKMHTQLAHLLPGQIGRFDDEYNRNCVGDTFQSLKTPTILIEAGHFPEDYEREKTRKYVFFALLSAFQDGSENVVVSNLLPDYLSIPQNNPNFFDIIYKNVRINYDNSNFITNFAVQFREELIDNYVHFNGFIAKVGMLEDSFGHLELDMNQKHYTDFKFGFPKFDEKADFSIGNEVKFVNGMIKK